MLGGLALVPMSADAVDLGSCETCQCLTEVGHLIFGVGARGNTALDWKNLLPHCNSATAINTNQENFFASFIPNVMERYSRKIANQTDREICLAQWLSFVGPIQDINEDKLECVADGKAPVPGVGQRITRRCEEDQASLKAAITYNRGDTSGLDMSCPYSPAMAMDMAVLVRLDNNDFIRNEGILDRLGQILESDRRVLLPTWLIVQHADQDRDLQRLALRRFKKLLQKGLVEPKKVAWLADRNMIADEHYQLYGSHTTCESETAVFEPPLDDPILADKRRAEIGLPPAQELLDERSSQACGGT